MSINTGPTFFHSVDSSSELDIEMLDINFDADSKSSSSLSQRLLFTLPPPSAREADMALKLRTLLKTSSSMVPPRFMQ